MNSYVYTPTDAKYLKHPVHVELAEFNHLKRYLLTLTDLYNQIIDQIKSIVDRTYL
jgi:hypothetical protein